MTMYLTEKEGQKSKICMLAIKHTFTCKRSNYKDEHDIKKLKKMIDILEDNDDVQKVHHNCSIDLEEFE